MITPVIGLPGIGASLSATPTGESSCTGVQTGLMRDPDFAALAVVCIANVEVDGRPITGWGVTHLRGAIDPTIVAGEREPRWRR